MAETPKYPGLRTEMDDRRRRSGLHDRVGRFLRGQFGRPSGLGGALVGKIMAARPSNQARIRWTISVLDIQPGDRVLEVGFGPGFGIELASQIATEGLVVGVDHSEVMVRQASKRNAEAIRAGRVQLWVGAASSLPRFDEPFDKIFTINSIHFWSEPVEGLRHLHAILKPGGLMGVTLQPRSRGATDTTTRTVGEEIAQDLRRAGFADVRLLIKEAKPVAVACALGVR